VPTATAPLALAATTTGAAHLPHGALALAVGALVLARVLARQLRARPVADDARLGVIVATVGLVETAAFARNVGLRPADLAVTTASLAIGGLLAVARARTLRLWRVRQPGEPSQVWQRGRALTVALWLAGLAQHLLLDSLTAPGLGIATLPLYLGISIGVQRYAVRRRAGALMVV
jgi:hypothetical protein